VSDSTAIDRHHRAYRYRVMMGPSCGDRDVGVQREVVDVRGAPLGRWRRRQRRERQRAHGRPRRVGEQRAGAVVIVVIVVIVAVDQAQDARGHAGADRGHVVVGGRRQRHEARATGPVGDGARRMAGEVAGKTLIFTVREQLCY
jgi:hypothetical protein